MGKAITYPSPGLRPAPMLWFPTAGSKAPIEIISAEWIARDEWAYVGRDGLAVYNLVEVKEPTE